MSSDLLPPPEASPELVVAHTVVEEPVTFRRRVVSGVSVVIAGLICIFAWGFGADPGNANFTLSEVGDKFTLPTIRIPGRAAAIVLGVIVLAFGCWQLARGFSRRQMKRVLIVVLFCFAAAFFCWVGTGTTDHSSIDLEGLLQNTLLATVPLILGALAGILCERTGVINVAIEGQLLVGAFAGALFGSIAHNLGVGVIAGMLAGGLMGALLAVLAIRYVVNQVILGVVLNVFALGLTGYGYDALMAKNASLNNPGHLGPLKIPLLGDIPVIGGVLFDDNIIVYLTYVLIIGVNVALFRTRFGLRTRAVGEHPRAADTVGIKVRGVRYRNVILGGLIAGLGGAFLTIGTVGSFTNGTNSVGLTNGKGFIALAAVIFGRWRPRGALGAALLFGFCDASGTLISIVGGPVTIPSNFLLMLPYLATLFAVAGLVGRVQAPAADGEPYVKG